MFWSNQSPGLNLIEHLWHILNRKIGNQAFRHNDDLKEAIVSVWDNITTEEIQNLVNSMPNSLAEVIKTKEGFTQC